MLEKSSWQPRISEGHGRLHERLASAFADDIIEQVICPGSRLPAHRELAYQLKVGVGTVTKAYALLEHQGLVRSDKGRAMFAVAASPSFHQVVDLSVNVPPKVVSDRLLSSTLNEVAKEIDASTFSSYPPLEGEFVHRAALASWLSETRVRVTGDDLILCNGVRHALAIAFGALRKPGETILTESLPYAGAVAISQAIGLELVGLPMDREGVIPAELEAWLVEHRGQSRPPVLYVTPTSQNPTGSSMSRQRREAIVEISRAFDVMIVEDDAYAVLGDTDIPTIRELAPERTIYVSGLSKTLTPGLRIGALVCPPSLKKQILKAIAAIGSPVSALACLIMARWIVSGTASYLSARVRVEAARRATLAAEILNITSPVPAASFHVFVPLPLVTATNVAARALELGVRVTKPSKALNDSNNNAGLRLCLGSPTFEQLRQSIQTVQKLVVEDFQHAALVPACERQAPQK